jgi:hypothetical protein
MFAYLISLDALRGLFHVPRSSAPVIVSVRSARRVEPTQHERAHFVWDRDHDGHIVRCWSK